MKHLIPGDYTRCSNQKCEHKTVCKRALQLEVDEKIGDDFKPTSVVEFSEINCERIIR